MHMCIFLVVRVAMALGVCKGGWAMCILLRGLCRSIYPSQQQRDLTAPSLDLFVIWREFEERQGRGLTSS